MSKIELKSRELKYSQFEPYLPSEELIEAVNLAIFLNRPLLLQGEPGSGKTKFAKYLVQCLYYEKYKDDWEKTKLQLYKEWFIKSTSKAKDGLYSYDHIGRLRDGQLGGLNQLSATELKKSKNLFNYVEFGALGETFRTKNERAVLLIDEIDKAEIDFPNDLLIELDEKRFVIEELPLHHKEREQLAKYPPIVIITTNNEKPLPDAFLRRCIYFYIKFPDTKLYDILSAHFPTVDQDLKKQAIETFIEIRNKMQNSSKKISTGELIDWFSVIEEEPEKFQKAIEARKLPFAGILLKSAEIIDRFVQLSS